MHIMSKDNKDIQGNEDESLFETLKQIFQNDYWGRPMNSPSSHKSWRPLTVMSFRYLKGLYSSYELTSHRIINIIAHSCTADFVGIIAIKLVPHLARSTSASNTEQA